MSQEFRSALHLNVPSRIGTNSRVRYPKNPRSRRNSLVDRRPPPAISRRQRTEILMAPSRPGGVLMAETHVTARTQTLETNGITFAYRKFGKETGTPLVFMQHF